MVRDLFSLTKFILSFAVSLSALFAYIMAKGDVDLRMIWITLAVLFVAMGASTLNQVQEYQSDAKMPRTANRPIASGRITVEQGLLIAFVLVVIALGFIYQIIGLIGVNFFIFALLWYNAVYTPLKKKSAFAVLPGALLGVIPPAVGWLAGNEMLMTIEFIALGLFYFIWQIPHFWLLVLLYHEDYKEGGYPTALKTFGKVSLQKLTFIWLMFTLNAGVFLVYVFEPYSSTIKYLLYGVGLWGFAASLPLLKSDFSKSDAKRVFWHINLAFWSVSILLALDAYISHHVV